MHSVEASFVADHCRIYALSDPTNEEYRRTCNHVHNDSCPQCSQLQSLLSTLGRKCSSEQLSEDDRAEMLHVFRQAKEDILSWKAHQLCSVHQAEAKHSVLESLDHQSVLLVQDWAMKYMPRKYREAQSDRFAKRGLPWHITVAIRRSWESGSCQSETFVHVFQSCSQDSAAVASRMRDCLSTLKRKTGAS